MDTKNLNRGGARTKLKPNTIPIVAENYSERKSSVEHDPFAADMANLTMTIIMIYWNRELDKLKNLEYVVGKNGQKVPLKKESRPKLYKTVYKTFWLSYFIIGICSLSNVLMQSLHVDMRIRIACSSLLYRKVIILNYKDVTAIIGIIMWQKVGISSFVGIGTLIIVLSGQGTLSFLNLKLRTMIAPLTDRRMQLMSELIAGIQVVKMYFWEKPFSQTIVSVIRKLEIKQIKFSLYVHATYLAIIVFTERLTVYFTLITFVLMGNNLTANVTYEMSTCFNIIQLVVALYFPQELILLGESIVSFNRLEDFLLMDEVNTRCFSENTPQLQFISQKPKEESNAENQIDRTFREIGVSFCPNIKDYLIP
ncbi:MRP4 protein, partial [Acromyrmex charruanus]